MAGEPTAEAVSERDLFAQDAGSLPRSLAGALYLQPTPYADGEVAPPNTSPPLVRHAARQQWPPVWNTRLLGRRAAAAVVIEWERGVLFLLAPIVIAAGVFAYLALPIEPSLPALGVVSTLIATVLWLTRHRCGLSIGLAACLLFVLGATFASIETRRVNTKMLGSEITTRLTGRVVDIDHLANGRIRLIMDVISTERPRLRYAPDRVRVSTTTVPRGLVAGSTVTGVARLFPPSGPLRPESYDFSYESYFDRLGGNGFFFRPPVLVNEAAPAPFSVRMIAAIDNFRNGIASHIRSAIGGAEGEIAAALVVGVRAGIPEEVNEALRRTGLAHILSISGLHMALVASSIMGVMRLAFAAFPAFASRHAVKKFAALNALVIVAAYLLVSGIEVAALRSFVMLAVMLIAVLFDRAALTMRNLAIAALLVVVVTPHEVVGPSFQMSFAATAALVGGYAAWSQWRATKAVPQMQRGLMHLLASKTLKLLGGIILTALIAGTATTIYGAWHFQRISPLSLFANLAVTPIITLVMWSGVFAAVAMPFGLDGPFLGTMGWGLSWMLAISEWLAARSPLDAIGVVPGGAVALLTVALLIATLATTWLRALALPFVALGLLSLAGRPLPDAFVSEDGKLVGVRTPAGTLAINRSRPNAFTVEDWQRALVAETIVKPANATDQEEEEFVCAEGACTIFKGRAMIAYVEESESVAVFCDTAALIVVAEANARERCGGRTATVITARDLALRGVAEVVLHGENHRAEITYAITQPLRPWHAGRQFSRAARGLAEYRPSGRAKTPVAVQ